MGWFKKLIGFENSFSKNIVKDIISDPKRLITGIDPLSTKAWNVVTGSDNQPLVNAFGSPGQQYYEKATAEGIDVGPAAMFHSVADKVAAAFAAQGLGIDASLVSKGGDFLNGINKPTTPGASVSGAAAFSMFDTDYISKLFSSDANNAASLIPSSFNSKDFAPIGGSGTVTMSKSSANVSTPDIVAPTISGTPIMPSTNENMYGGIADSYAAKYNIPIDVFRNTIRRLSDFNPANDNHYGKGIAGIDVGTTGIDQMDVGKQLNYAAQYMADRYKKIGNWDDTVTDYLIGSENAGTSSDGKTLAENEAAINGESAPEESKAFWKYGLSDVQGYLQKSAWSILFILIGVVIILVSLYVLIVKSGDIGK